MAKAIATRANYPGAIEHEPPASDSARGAIIAGVAILVLFFGGLGTWAATAPLHGAVIGEAVVKVSGNRKSVQHLDGGIVKELRVRDGDTVAAGDTLIVLDDSAVRAEHDVLLQQYALLRATEARLDAELAGQASVTFPKDLVAAAAGDPHAAKAIAGQQSEFAGRRAAIDGQELVLRQRIAQLTEEIAGHQAQAEAARLQRESVVAEKDSLAELLAKQLVARSRVLQLERAAADLEGQAARADSAIAAANRAIAELEEQIAQLGKDRHAEIGRELRDVQTRLLDVAPRLRNVATSLERLDIRSPYAGKVVDLAVFSVGGVIRPGDRILDVVPEETHLVVEARVAVEDISDLRPGMRAEVHFTSYKQRVIPLIHGEVATVSADRLTDEKTGKPYYVAEVSVDPDELAASPEIQLYPGMPATVMVTTVERTALDYLIGPLVASFDKSFRQR